MLGHSRLGAVIAMVMTTGFAAMRPDGELIDSRGWHTPTLTGRIQPTWMTKWTYGGPGTTAAQIKRASKKARNVRRHKGRA